MNQEIAGHMGSVKALDLAVRKKKISFKVLLAWMQLPPLETD